MTRTMVVLSASWVVALAALGCGSGVSADEAKLRCDQQRTADTVCVDDKAYQQCLSCQEECGDQCATLDSCPAQFSCPK